MHLATSHSYADLLTPQLIALIIIGFSLALLTSRLAPLPNVVRQSLTAIAPCAMWYLPFAFASATAATGIHERAAAVVCNAFVVGLAMNCIRMRSGLFPLYGWIFVLLSGTWLVGSYLDYWMIYLGHDFKRFPYPIFGAITFVAVIVDRMWSEWRRWRGSRS